MSEYESPVGRDMELESNACSDERYPTCVHPSICIPGQTGTSSAYPQVIRQVAAGHTTGTAGNILLAKSKAHQARSHFTRGKVLTTLTPAERITEMIDAHTALPERSVEKKTMTHDRSTQQAKRSTRTREDLNNKEGI